MTDHTERTIQHIPIANLDLQDRTFCFRVDINVARLAQDIDAHGQDVPIVVRHVGERLQLVCGFRRVHALRHLGREIALAEIRSLTDDAAYRLSWSENERRKSYTDLDRAHAIVKANRAGKTMKQLEQVFGLQRKQLTRLKQLITMPEQVKQGLREGKIKTTHAIVLNQLKARYPSLDIPHWIEEVNSAQLSVQRIRDRISQIHHDERAHNPPVTHRDGMLIFRARKLRLEAMDKTERQQVVLALKQALAMLEGH